jgi:hypothetical protein
MNALELAEKLNGREYGEEISREEERLVKESNLLVIFGASDDLLELRGIISDEAGCFGGGSFLIDSKGIIPSWENVCRDDEESVRLYFMRKPAAKSIKAIWCHDGVPWRYETDIPHLTFNVMEGLEIYCIGMVIHRDDLTPLIKP